MYQARLLGRALACDQTAITLCTACPCHTLIEVRWLAKDTDWTIKLLACLSDKNSCNKRRGIGVLGLWRSLVRGSEDESSRRSWCDEGFWVEWSDPTSKRCEALIWLALAEFSFDLAGSSRRLVQSRSPSNKTVATTALTS
jgi:hypothetical protein